MKSSCHHSYQYQGYERLVHITVIMYQCHWKAQPTPNLNLPPQILLDFCSTVEEYLHSVM